MTQRNNSTLLITGAIDINACVPKYTKLTDTGERLKQYEDSIEYAIRNYKTISNIIFCENTKFGFKEKEFVNLSRSFKKQFEYLTFQGNYDRIQLQGKGYGEGEIIKYALMNSHLLKNSTSFVKLTGRLTVANFDMLIKKVIKKPGNYFQLPSLFRKNKTNTISTVLYSTETSFYIQNLLDLYKMVDDSQRQILEFLFYRAISVHEVYNFPYYPVIRGLSGTSGNPYNNISFFDLKKRQLIHRLTAITKL